MEENRNFIMAIVLTMAILFGWEYFYGAPMREAAEQQAANEQAVDVDTAGVPQMAAGSAADAGSIPGMSAPVVKQIATDRVEIIDGRDSIKIDSARLSGSISLKGLRFDDLSLKDYHETVDKSSPIITLLNPSGSFNSYFADFGWIGDGKRPDANSVWSANKATLGAGETVTFTWDNGEGVIFNRDVALDNDYMFTVTQRVQNNSQTTLGMATYGRVFREGRSGAQPLFILHEGPIRVGEDGKEEIAYEDLEDDTYERQEVSNGGWAGITDKEWMVAVIPDQSEDFVTNISRTEQNGGEQFHVNFATNGVSVAPGVTFERSSRFFAGAKEIELLEQYTEAGGIKMFDYAVDWGWFYFITKPIYFLLHFFYGIVSNFGIAILLLTLLIKGILFPMANKQYISMARMKKLAPKMQKLKEKYGDDRARMQQETMKLYQEEKVNPLASCLPIFIQIPIFFSLYKVLYVTIDMRHAPFYGWIKDLSAPDPLLVTNLFGLIPWEPTGFLAIGILPVFMGATMYFQQKLNPPMTDPIQQKVFAFMPIIFTFILAGFSVGLVIYWTWNNILTICQQWFIMRRVEALEK
ncbi:membrane protein insertase YidC [Pseudemcibacter aquimaris]|uniref:membrane protein insertase YidC n=1 Tax=Pseudemcibacter aquimaris TaxID=2857064 RepID=UPI0020113B58|nr:membrane protein insertase YidC [Pseudemcibacter aquimaris]MCC3861413.1 membrane protein insertase YidC [Pseudemcibacter aquimaris]WDU58183.1 membrane protein insertase YidC [Pseudemcibacter aquimaris]